MKRFFFTDIRFRVFCASLLLSSFLPSKALAQDITANISVTVRTDRDVPIILDVFDENNPENKYTYELIPNEKYEISDIILAKEDTLHNPITGFEERFKPYENKLIIAGNPSNELEAFFTSNVDIAHIYTSLGQKVDEVKAQQQDGIAHIFKDLSHLSDGLYIVKAGDKAFRFQKDNNCKGDGPTSPSSVKDKLGEMIIVTTNDNASVSNGRTAAIIKNFGFFVQGNFGVERTHRFVRLGEGQNASVDFFPRSLEDPYFLIDGTINANSGLVKIDIEGTFHSEDEIVEGKYELGPIETSYGLRNIIIPKESIIYYISTDGSFNNRSVTGRRLTGNKEGLNLIIESTFVQLNDTTGQGGNDKSNVIAVLHDQNGNLITNYLALVNGTAQNVSDTLKINNLPVDATVQLEFDDNNVTSVDIANLKESVSNLQKGENFFTFNTSTTPWYANLLVQYTNGANVKLESEGKTALSNEQGTASITDVTILPTKIASKIISASHSRDDLVPKNTTYTVTSGNNTFTESLEKLVSEQFGSFTIDVPGYGTYMDKAIVDVWQLQDDTNIESNRTNQGIVNFSNKPLINNQSTKYVIKITSDELTNKQFLPTFDTLNIASGYNGLFTLPVNQIPNHQDKEFFTYDETSRQLINGVNVEIFNATTNALVGSKVSSNGKVSFNDLTPGNYYLNTSKSGNFTEGGPEYKFTIISPQTAKDTIAFYTNLAMLQKTGNLTAAYINEMEGSPNPEMVTGRGKIYLPSGYERAQVLAAIQDGDAILGTTTQISDTPGNITNTMDLAYNPWNNYYEGQWIFNAIYVTPGVAPQYKYVNLDNKIINQKVMHNPSTFSTGSGSNELSAKKEVFGRLYDMQPVGSRPSMMNSIATDITPIDVEVWNAIVTGQKNMFEYKDTNGNPIDFYQHYNLSE